MKTFFLMPRRMHCDSSCNYQCCPHKYLRSLRELEPLHSIEILDGSYGEGDCPPDMLPQHGDIVIMFAGDADDLEQMIGYGECFEFTRNIVVVGDGADFDTGRCHLLGPRFITRMERSVDELESVILRMQDKSARTLMTMGMQQ